MLLKQKVIKEFYGVAAILMNKIEDHRAENQGNIEIYVRDCPHDKIVSWLSRVFGPLEKVTNESDLVIYHTSHRHSIIPISIQENMNDGSFLSRTIRGGQHILWATEIMEREKKVLTSR